MPNSERRQTAHALPADPSRLSSSELEWGQWTAPLPLERIDRDLVLLRLGMILVLGIPSLFGPFRTQALLPPVVAFLAILLYNALVSYLVWLRRPLAQGRATWLLVNDTVQFTLIVLFTGGYHSFYSLLFLLVMLEIGLTLRPRWALALVISLDALQLVASVIGQGRLQGSRAPYIVVSEFLVLLIAGAVFVLLGELVRREEEARRRVTRRAAQVTELNRLLMQLGENVPNLDRLLHTVLDGALSLPGVTFGLVLLPVEGEENTWEVVASNSERHPVGKHLTGSILPQGTSLPGVTSPGEAATMPPFVVDDDVDQLVGLYLSAPDGEGVGALVVGRSPGKPWVWNEEDKLFLHALAIEAGLALRNARLFAHEQEHIRHLQRFQASRTAFFSAIAHELKTPLTVLKMLAPSLRDLPSLPPETRQEILDTMDQSLARLEDLIRDMLESARLEAGAVELHRQPVHLERLVERTLKELAPLLARKNQEARMQAEPELPPVWADPRRVEQILSNLVGNAAKFSPPASEILVELAHHDQVVQVCVADRGPGVPAQERQRIFDRFYTTTENQTLSGVGLGLFICRELVHLHGGSIWVEDREGGGSCFCFTLPVHAPPDTKGEPDGNPPQSHA